MVAESIEDARAQASVILQKLRQQGVLPGEELQGNSQLATSPKTEDAVACVVHGDILRSQASMESSDDELDMTDANDVDEPEEEEASTSGILPEQPGSVQEVTVFPARSSEDKRWEAHELRFTWAQLDADLLDEVPEGTLREALLAHRQGLESPDEPNVLDVLKNIKGEVAALVKVDVPTGSKKGTRISFKWEGTPVQATYRGSKVKEEGKKAVFVVHERLKSKSLKKKLVSGLTKVGTWRARPSSGGTDKAEEWSELSVVEAAGSELLAGSAPKDASKVGFVWCDIACSELVGTPRAELDQALAHRIKGTDEFMPAFLYEGLKQLDGTVAGLIKVRVPAGTEEGRMLSFGLETASANLKALYSGPTTAEDTDAVFAMIDKPAGKPLSGRLSNLTSSLGRLSLRGRRSKPEDEHSPTSAAALRSDAGSDAGSSDTASPAARDGAGKKVEYVWSGIQCEELEQLEEEQVAAAMAALNRGERDRVPQFLLDGLWQHRGRVAGVVKVMVDADTKKGQKLTFEHMGRVAIGVYNGPLKEAHLAVFVVREKRSLLSGLSNRVAAGLHKYDALRGLKDEPSDEIKLPLEPESAGIVAVGSAT